MRYVARADFAQYFVHIVYLPFVFEMGGIDDVQQYIGQCGFFQRGGEGGHQAVRQVAHEAHRIGEYDAGGRVEIQAAGGGVQCGEELVFGQDVGFGQAVEQAGFAGIGVADQREGGQAAVFARLAAGGALAADGFEPFFQGGDFLCDQAAVGFELGFPRPFQADAAFLALQVAVAAHEAAGKVGQLRQFDLQSPFLALRPLGKNGQYQADAVEHAALQGFFEIALLGGGEFVVEHGQFDLPFANGLRQFFGLAGADKQGGMGTVAFGGLTADEFAPGGADEFFRFGHCGGKGAFAGFVRAGVVGIEHQADQHDAFGFA